MSHKLGSATKVGDALPNVEVHIGFAGLSPTNAKMTGDLAKGKTLWVPGLLKAESDGTLKEAGIEKVYVFCVNDGAVMTGWKKDQGVPDTSMIEFVADTQAALTVGLDIVLTTHPGPAAVLGAQTMRCKRTAMVVVDGIIKAFVIAEAEDDPAGDAKPDATLVDAMLPLMKAA